MRYPIIKLISDKTVTNTGTEILVKGIHFLFYFIRCGAATGSCYLWHCLDQLSLGLVAPGPS